MSPAIQPGGHHHSRSAAGSVQARKTRSGEARNRRCSAIPVPARSCSGWPACGGGSHALSSLSRYSPRASSWRFQNARCCSIQAAASASGSRDEPAIMHAPDFPPDDQAAPFEHAPDASRSPAPRHRTARRVRVTEHGPCASRSTMPRRIGSDRAAKISSSGLRSVADGDRGGSGAGRPGLQSFGPGGYGTCACGHSAAAADGASTMSHFKLSEAAMTSARSGSGTPSASKLATRCRRKISHSCSVIPRPRCDDFISGPA